MCNLNSTHIYICVCVWVHAYERTSILSTRSKWKGEQQGWNYFKNYYYIYVCINFSNFVL